MTLEAIKWNREENKLVILDQTLLPNMTLYLHIKDVHDSWKVINMMKIRGAPAIAIIGCLSLASEIIKHKEFKNKQTFCNFMKVKLNYLVTARPTAVNMKKAADEFIKLANELSNDSNYSLSSMKDRILNDLEGMLKIDVKVNMAIGDNGAQEILSKNASKNSITILTHCNTGSLATAGYGTALGVIRSLHKMGKLTHVYCTETRPYNQGARLTAYELVHDKIPATLICDDMVAAVLKTKKITAVVVGADRVTLNGDTANKIGTYQIAILAKYHNVPFYVAAPRTSIDTNMHNGDDIIIEKRSAEEITHINGNRIAAEGIECWNPAFDVTPASLITGIITEIGTFSPEELKGHI